MQPHHVTGLVDALHAAGFVARNPHPTDRRTILVILTPQGHALAAPWHADRDHNATVLFGDITPAELATVVTMLDRVLTRLRHHNESPSA